MAIDKEITIYLPLLNDTQKEAILAVIKTFTQEPPANEYSEDFINELNSRFADYESGSIMGFPWKKQKTE